MWIKKINKTGIKNSGCDCPESAGSPEQVEMTKKWRADCKHFYCLEKLFSKLKGQVFF